MTDAPAAELPDDDIPFGDTLTVAITLPDPRFLDEAGLARWFPQLDGTTGAARPQGVGRLSSEGMSWSIPASSTHWKPG